MHAFNQARQNHPPRFTVCSPFRSFASLSVYLCVSVPLWPILISSLANQDAASRIPELAS